MDRPLLLLSLVVVIAGTYRLRVRNLENLGRQLEQQVQERTAELSATNLRLQQEMWERKQAEQTLAQERAEAAVVAERNRLARDLHDSVTQALYTASLIAEALPGVWQRYPEEALDGLEELRNLTQGALAEMRAMLLEMRPDALANRQLSELLHQLTDALSARTDLPITTTVAATTVYRLTTRLMTRLPESTRRRIPSPNKLKARMAMKKANVG